jgi:transaldolase
MRGWLGREKRKKSDTFEAGKSARPAPAELPQDRKVARVGGCSGAMLACLFFCLCRAREQTLIAHNVLLSANFSGVKITGMKFFIDTANLKEIKEAYDLGVLDGVTTNPSLMAKEGIGGDKVRAHYKAICDIVDNNVSAEVISTDLEGMLREGRELAKIDNKIVVKIPMIRDGVKAIKKLTSEGIRTNCTLIFSAGQALLAAKAGASYVSPFIGRLDDVGQDGLELIVQIRQIFDNYAYKTEILAASIRHTIHLLKCAEIGADVATCPLKVITDLLNHPLTDAGLAKFLSDHKKANG